MGNSDKRMAHSILPVILCCRYPNKTATSVIWVHPECAEHFQIKVAKNLSVEKFAGNRVYFQGHTQNYPVVGGKLVYFQETRRWRICFPSVLHVRVFPIAVRAMLANYQTPGQVRVYGPVMTRTRLDDRLVRSEAKVSILEEPELGADGCFLPGTTVTRPVISRNVKPAGPFVPNRP